MKKQLFERYLLFLVGLFIASMGVAFSTKAGLGILYNKHGAVSFYTMLEVDKVRELATLQPV